MGACTRSFGVPQDAKSKLWPQAVVCEGIDQPLNVSDRRAAPASIQAELHFECATRTDLISFHLRNGGLRMSNKKLGVVVSVINLKGGVGKTTVSAHVMRLLYRTLRKKVLLIDLDPQFNLTQTLLTRKEYEKHRTSGSTVFAAMEPASKVSLFDVATTTQKPPAASTLATRLRNLSNAWLDLVPGDFDLVKYSLISDHAKLDKVRQRFLRFVSDARAEYDLVVIDCNPSSSFITLCALHACTQLLVPVRPDKYSVLGVELLADFLERLPDIDPKPKISILLNGIPTSRYDPGPENELRQHKTFGTEVLANRLRVSALLTATSAYTGFATDKPVANRHVLATEINLIVHELGQRWGL